MRDDERQARRPDEPTSGSSDAGQANTPISFATLSAYLDDPSDFASEERTRIDAYLATPGGKARVAEVRMLAAGLRELPQAEPPRSFRLAPEQVGAREPVALQETSAWYARHGATLRWATAAAALLFVLVVSADLITHGVRPDSGSSDETTSQFRSDEAAPESASGGQAEATAETGAAEAEATAQEETMDLYTDDATQESEASPGDGESSGESDSAPAATDSGGDSAQDSQATEGGDEAARNSGEGEPTAASEATPQPEMAELQETEDAADADADAEVAAQAEPDESRAGWRVVEFSIVVVLVVLLMLLAILPRVGRQRGS